jgi:hypothetical protein
MNFCFGGDDVQLSKAFIQVEPGVHCGQDFCADWEASRFVLMIESTQPRYAGLTDVALSVVEQTITGGYGPLRIRSLVNLG